MPFHPVIVTQLRETSSGNRLSRKSDGRIRDPANWTTRLHSCSDGSEKVNSEVAGIDQPTADFPFAFQLSGSPAGIASKHFHGRAIGRQQLAQFFPL